MRVTERNGSIGVVKGSGDSEMFHQRGNFVLKIVVKVEGGKDGYVARVTRLPRLCDKVMLLNKLLLSL